MLFPRKKISFKHLLKLDISYNDKLREWRNQQFVRVNMFNKDYITEQQHSVFLQSVINKNREVYIGFIDNEPFGVLQLTSFYDERQLEFGYYLVDGRYLNSGLGIIMEYKMLEYGFNKLGVDRIFCRTLKSNEKVIRIHKKFGFQIDENDKISYCTQSITENMWKLSKPKIEKMINSFFPIDQIDDVS